MIMTKLTRFFPLLLLAGCSPYAETFDCHPGVGVGCLALHKVDARVDQKTLPFQVEEEKEEPKKESLPPKTSFVSQEPLDLLQRKRSRGIVRRPERAITVWRAPYEDAQGHFHEASVIHMVLTPGHWEKR